MAPKLRRRGRCLVLGAALLAMTACSGSDEDAESPRSTETTAPASTAPPPLVVLGIAQELAVVSGQCWAPLPTPQPSTSVPASASVAVVECNGASPGIAFGNGCFAGGAAAARDPVTVVACPGNPDDNWPGQREMRKAAEEHCLPSFEAVTGERYGTSALVADEWLPTEQLWDLGERRFVCTAS